MNLQPRSRSGRAGLNLLYLIELGAAVGILVVLGFVLPLGVIAATGVLTVLAVGFGYWRARKWRRLRATDPAEAQRLSDRDATRYGKFYAGIAFVTMGVGIVAIIVIFATHA